MNEEPRDDGELTDEQRALVNQLTPEQVAEIDRILLSFVPQRFGKVAMVVGKTMMSFGDDRIVGIPDIYYAERVRLLAEAGVIESVGNLRRMRFSEVRRRPTVASSTSDEPA
jgi:hypothetical protein